MKSCIKARGSARARSIRISTASLWVLIALSCAPGADGQNLACPGLSKLPFRDAGTWVQPGFKEGSEILPGIQLLTGNDLKPFQTRFCVPELADPYVTQMKDSVIVSGTAEYYLAFPTIESIQNNDPYEIVWNDYYYSDGTPMEGDRYYANSWDMKPSLWSKTSTGTAHLWNPQTDTQPPLVVWYGGHMRPFSAHSTARWPDDNYSRDVFAFTEREPGKWYSESESIFSNNGTWPRNPGNYLGHRYGHQIIGRADQSPLVFYEEVTDVNRWGGPTVTKIFMDEMATPFQARGNPVELVSPFNPVTGRPYPSTIREDGSVLVEGPLYFKFQFGGELWEAIGFSAGSFYSHYPSAFASRRVSDGLLGKPYRIDLLDDGSDLHDAGAELGSLLGLIGGPGRPSVMVDSDGMALPDSDGDLRLLVHAYRKDILPDNNYGGFPTKYSLDQMYRVIIQAKLKVEQRPNGRLRFKIAVADAHSKSSAPRPLQSTPPRPFSEKWF
ncbi:MAG: hypothetical protein ACJ763_08625 [Bdellovibrionia bacterium]